MHSEDSKAVQEKNKKRTVKTRTQVKALEKFYNEHKYPTERMKLVVADSIGLTEKQVSGWFCHRRLKDKTFFFDEKHTTAGKQDRSSSIIQDRGSGYRHVSCGSTEQGDDLNMDTREVESDSLTPTDGDDLSSGSSSSLGQNGVPFDPVNSRYSVPKFNAGGEKTRTGPSGYLNVKGQVAMKRYGKNYREDGGLLPPGVFESLTEETEEVKGKEKASEAEKSTPNKKRPPCPSSEEVRPSKKSRKSSSSNPQDNIATPNHSFFNKSVLENTDPTYAIQFMESLCPPAENEYIDALSDEDFTKEYALHASKFVVHMAFCLDRATKLDAELTAAEGEVASLRSQLNQAMVEAKSKSQELETKSKEIEEMASRLSNLKAQEVEKVQAAHEEGVIAGRAGYLRSQEGLMMVDRIREVTRESLLHSKDFCRAVVDVTKFYGKYLLGKVKEWVDSGSALEAFSMDRAMKNGPDAPRLLLTEGHQRMEKLSAEGLLDYLEAQDRAGSSSLR